LNEKIATSSPMMRGGLRRGVENINYE